MLPSSRLLLKGLQQLTEKLIPNSTAHLGGIYNRDKRRKCIIDKLKKQNLSKIPTNLNPKYPTKDYEIDIQ